MSSSYERKNYKVALISVGVAIFMAIYTITSNASDNAKKTNSVDNENNIEITVKTNNGKVIGMENTKSTENLKNNVKINVDNNGENAVIKGLVKEN